MAKGFDYSKNNLIVLSSQGEAFKVYSALNSLYPDQDFIHLPNSEVLPYDFFSSTPNIDPNPSHSLHAPYGLLNANK